MMEFKLLKRRFREFGGLRLVRIYIRLGVCGTIIKEFFGCLIHRRSLRYIYPKICQVVDPILIERYKPKTEITDELPHEHPRRIWWCWLQGEDKAPDIVKACLSSLRQHLPDYEITIIDEKNYSHYVCLPDNIVEKRKKGYIPTALFSDLLRLELLIKYGGSWIDSTVLCTGFTKSQMVADGYKLLEADLFLFQYTQLGSKRFGGISNWFISAYSNHPLLISLRDMLYAYWRDYDCAIEYYIFHLFFDVLRKVYPEYIRNMPYGYSRNSLVLMYHWREEYDQKKWDNLTSKVCFHKLSSRPKKKVLNSFYDKIINTYYRKL